jgi:hypothetical protein
MHSDIQAAAAVEVSRKTMIGSKIGQSSVLANQ